MQRSELSTNQNRELAADQDSAVDRPVSDESAKKAREAEKAFFEHVPRPSLRTTAYSVAPTPRQLSRSHTPRTDEEVRASGAQSSVSTGQTSKAGVEQKRKNTSPLTGRATLTRSDPKMDVSPGRQSTVDEVKATLKP